MQFQDEDIKKLAVLSRLRLTPQEVERFRDQLSSVLQYVEQVERVSVNAEKSMTGITAEPVFREDNTRPSEASPDELLASAPKTEEGHVSVLSVK